MKKQSKDAYNQEEAAEGEMDKEMPAEHELDDAHHALMKAEAIKGNKKLMKHLGPHMQKKMGHMKAAMGGMGTGAPDKIRSIADLKKVAKEKSEAD